MWSIGSVLSFQLMPSYRGYTVDSLGGLTSLDDVIITADERHDFKGLNKRGTELLKNEARLTIKLPFVRGLPNSAAEADEVRLHVIHTLLALEVCGKKVDMS